MDEGWASGENFLEALLRAKKKLEPLAQEIARLNQEINRRTFQAGLIPPTPWPGAALFRREEKPTPYYCEEKTHEDREGTAPSAESGESY